jgi:hypothetical protein
MTRLVREAKSSSDWTATELFSYNITVKTVSPQEFFPSGTVPSLDHLDEAILSLPPGTDDPIVTDAATNYLAYIDFAEGAFHEDILPDFVAETLKLLRFNERSKVMANRLIIPFQNFRYGDCTAQADMSVLHHPTGLVLLVMIKDKSLHNSMAQIIAVAIATFDWNNRQRTECGLSRLHEMTIPGILMSGTCPTFCLIPVTQELSTAVKRGKYPANETKALKCVTVIDDTQSYTRWVMKDIEHRKTTLQRFLAFKMLASSYWDRMLEGYRDRMMEDFWDQMLEGC